MLRNTLAGLSGYYATQAAAIRAIDAALLPEGLTTGDASGDASGDAGRMLLPIIMQYASGPPFGYASFAWHRMPSSQFAVTTYLT